ncbi:hypothetical protein [Amycolatopsis sp. BJA-103]|uniref:hypothetical protein n=1 Tax=unclassified Amycolatopsis TaxID=2618356 RepID=UPI000C783505|nr:hypothetical protein [Amycolatopsis sp. BJA-103]AUI58204.1 hypothetical protein BKN51_08180 [Amycolatopsis sp. BJA-103]
MGFTPSASTAGIAGLSGILPMWCVIAIVLTGLVLVVLKVIVTQIIRLRASSRITTSAHALRVLEIEGRRSRSQRTQ